MSLLLPIVRPLTITVGALFIYLAAFTYETTDKRIKNTLEDLWLRLAYTRGTPAGLAKRLARVVLSLMDGIFDRVFGGSQLSIQTLSVSLCYTYSALTLCFIPIFLLATLGEIDIGPALKALPAPGHLTIFAAAALAIGTLPALRASLRWVTYAAAAWILLSLAAAVWAVATGRLEVTAMTATLMENLRDVLVALLIALAYGIGMVHAIRDSVYMSVRREGTRRNVVLVGIVLIIPIIASAALVSLAVIIRRPRGQLTVWMSHLLGRKMLSFLFLVGGPLSVWGLVLLIAVALFLLVLMHLAMWPIIRFFLMKTLYAAHRHELISRKTRLWSVGVGLVGSTFIPAHELWSKITSVILFSHF
jgi:hypothetical protein